VVSRSQNRDLHPNEYKSLVGDPGPWGTQVLWLNYPIQDLGHPCVVVELSNPRPGAPANPIGVIL
jgi:hypothetical protein